MEKQVRVKKDAGKLYATYLIKEVFSHPVEFETAYLEQARMHWLYDHAGEIVTDTGKTVLGYRDIIAGNSSCLVSSRCLEEIE